MKTFNTILSTLCLLAFQTVSAQVVNVQEAIKNAPKEVPDKVSFVKKENGKTISSKTITYSYDKEGRLTEIKSNTDDYTFKYSYADNNVSRVIVSFRNNDYVQADFTYNNKGAMTKVERSGQEKTVLNLKDKNDTRQTYSWTDNKGRYHELYMDNKKNSHYTIVEHRIGKDAFKFSYDKSGTNGLENLPVPIMLATYMAMEYYNTDFYSSGFLQCIMSKPLKSITDPRENGKLYTYNSNNGLYKYLKNTSVKNGTFLNTWSFSYRKPASELKVDPKVLENKKVDKIKIGK